MITQANNRRKREEPGMTNQTFQEYCNRIRKLERRVEAIEQRFNAEIRKDREQQEMVSEPTSETRDIKVTVINKSKGVSGMTIKDLYEGYVWKIQQITKDIARLEGERDVLTDVKNDLYNIIQEQERVKAGVLND